MAKMICCPWYSGSVPDELHCKIARLRFATRQGRREYINRYCGSVDGWRGCSLAIHCNTEYEEGRMDD